MTDQTEQKILDAALKIFAEKGYKGATTRDIAAKAGVNDSTLFRKFENKKNLYDIILTKNTKKLEKEFLSIFADKEFENSRDLLESYVKNLAKVSLDNFDFLFISITQKSHLFESNMGEMTTFLEKQIEKNIKNEKINSRTLGLTIFSFILLINIERYFERDIIDYDVAIEEFIDNLLLCIQ
ncbi:MAG: TetR/AcrR family transcriptional regulator [Methanobacterium sp.]